MFCREEERCVHFEAHGIPLTKFCCHWRQLVKNKSKLQQEASLFLPSPTNFLPSLPVKRNTKTNQNFNSTSHYSPNQPSTQQPTYSPSQLVRCFDFVRSYTICVIRLAVVVVVIFWNFCCLFRPHTSPSPFIPDLSSVVCDSKTDKCLCWCVNIKWNVYACEKFSAAQHSTDQISCAFFFISLRTLLAVCAWACATTIRRKTMNKVLEMDLDRLRLCQSAEASGKRWQEKCKTGHREDGIVCVCVCRIFTENISNFGVFSFTLLAQWQNRGFRLRRTERRTQCAKRR